MWYEKLNFVNKEIGLDKAVSLDCLHTPLSEKEISEIVVCKLNEEQVSLQIPQEIFLPDEYIELLHFSNGGLITNEDREFGYFGLTELRDFYFGYEFFKYAPLFLPVAFNGGGVFYAYDFRDTHHIKIVAVSAGDLDYNSAVDLGTSLKEVLKQTENIENKLNKNYPPPVLSAEEKRKCEIWQELASLKKERENEIIDLKRYLKEKRRLEDELGLMPIKRT